MTVSVISYTEDDDQELKEMTKSLAQCGLYSIRSFFKSIDEIPRKSTNKVDKLLSIINMFEKESILIYVSNLTKARALACAMSMNVGILGVDKVSDIMIIPGPTIDTKDLAKPFDVLIIFDELPKDGFEKEMIKPYLPTENSKFNMIIMSSIGHQKIPLDARLENIKKGPKSAIYEYCVSQNIIKPDINISHGIGKDHDKTFNAIVNLTLANGNVLIGESIGKTKKSAEKSACLKICEQLFPGLN